MRNDIRKLGEEEIIFINNFIKALVMDEKQALEVKVALEDIIMQYELDMTYIQTYCPELSRKIEKARQILAEQRKV